MTSALTFRHQRLIHYSNKSTKHLPSLLFTETQKWRGRWYLVEESFWELLETLGAHEALLVVKFPVAVHDLLQRGEAALAALAHGVGQSVGHVAERTKRFGDYSHLCNS